ncbi:MAG: glycoside hydrolase family 130 protein [Planctomycetota bacterium]
MLQRLFTTRLLKPGDLPPSDQAMRVVGVCNPAAQTFGDGVALVARVVEQPVEQRPGQFPSPRYADGSLVTDWLDAEDCDSSDPRLYVGRRSGVVRLRFVSHLRVFLSEDGTAIDEATPAAMLIPQGPYESFGIEDPRITKIGATYYITYVGVSPHGVCTRMMSTTDFVQFHRHGTIFCPDNKDVVLFPEKVLGEYVALHRPMPSMRFSPPQVWLARSPDLLHWGNHQPLLGGDGAADAIDRVGGGTPPIRTDRGWLTLYHASDKKHGEQGVGVYTASAMILDEDHPAKIVARSRGPVMQPEEMFERQGFVDNVVFPTAMLRRDGMLFVYYGAADENLAVCGFGVQDLLDACLPV